MEVQLTSDQKAFVRQAIESGRLRREEDAVKEALSLWEERYPVLRDSLESQSKSAAGAMPPPAGRAPG
jgi:Arc/MetJ-type ribon-helix-helix transcriptional regulator